MYKLLILHFPHRFRIKQIENKDKRYFLFSLVVLSHVKTVRQCSVKFRYNEIKLMGQNHRY